MCWNQNLIPEQCQLNYTLIIVIKNQPDSRYDSDSSPDEDSGDERYRIVDLDKITFTHLGWFQAKLSFKTYNKAMTLN